MKVVNRDLRIQELPRLEEETNTRSWWFYIFGFALEASRSLASVSILLKLRSRTGLINVLEDDQPIHSKR